MAAGIFPFFLLFPCEIFWPDVLLMKIPPVLLAYNWIDGTSFDFKNGLPEPANSSDEECYGFQKDGTWPNVSCDSTLLAYICRRPAGNSSEM